MNRHWEQNKDATIYVGNLDERFGEGMMWELMVQMGPVMNVHMPMDRVSRTHQGYGFVEFDTPESADYAARCLNGIRVYGKPVRVNKASADKQRGGPGGAGGADIGAELFINNLDSQVDEKTLYDTFSRFGILVSPPSVVRDANNVPKGYGFVSFDSFEASDAAREAMSGQYLLSKQIAVEYAYKKDGKGERHGDEAERKLAAEGRKHNVMPEKMPMPSAFLMTAPNGTTGANNIPLGTPGAAAENAPPIPPPQLAGGAPSGMPAPPPMGFGRGGPPTRGMPPPAPPGMYNGVNNMHQGPPSHQYPPHQQPHHQRAGSAGLPPAPTGLPARPPPSQAGYNGPPDFQQGGAPGAPPPGFRGGPPPPGFAPPGFGGPNGMPPPPGGPPAGFMPPPGFGPPPGQQMPPGFARGR